ncbi:MAG: hypothetical protein JJU36_13030 [Phycisphaeraceae bacterium]|nr:hypothetical protein [Phycisphaeraceae bacterium]
MKMLLSCMVVCVMLVSGCASAPRGESGEADAVATPAAEWEVVARLDKAPGNVTVTPAGQVVFSLHQHFEPRLRVGRLGENSTIIPFPNEAINGISGDSPLVLDTVLGIQSDTNGIVWMLDNGMRGVVTPKLVAWDTRSDQLHRVIHLPKPVTVSDSFVNDLAVDMTNRHIYIADPAGGPNAALIVVDLDTGLSRRVLQGDRSVVPEDIDMVIDRITVEVRRPDGTRVRPRVGVNPIALDVENQWLYFGPMHGRTMYRVRTRELRDPELSDEQLAARVERYADKPISDGSSIDREGNIYISDVTSNAVGIIGTDRQYRVHLQDPRVFSWPDAFSYGPDGLMYVVANQLHRGPVLNAGQDATRPPFYIIRFKPPAPGVVGR